MNHSSREPVTHFLNLPLQKVEAAEREKKEEEKRKEVEKRLREIAEATAAANAAAAKLQALQDKMRKHR